MGVKQIIQEEIILQEGLSDILYHFTHTGAVQNILKTNKINTSSNLGTSADAAHDKGRFFFFSTQRSKGFGGYGKGGNNATLVLDGRKLMTRYKGFPVDYWGWSMSPKKYDSTYQYKQALLSKEMEDRIVTNEPYIEPASDFITEVHIDLDTHPPSELEARKMIADAGSKGIGIYFYSDTFNYKALNKAKSVDPFTTELKDHEGSWSSRDPFIESFKKVAPYMLIDAQDENPLWQLLMEYLKSKDWEKEFDEIKRLVLKSTDYIEYQKNRNGFYPDDSDYTSILNDFHNNRSATHPHYRKFLSLVVRDINRIGAKSFMDYVEKKFTPKVA